METTELNSEQKDMICKGIDALYFQAEAAIDTRPDRIKEDLNYILLKIMDLYYILKNADSIQITKS